MGVAGHDGGAVRRRAADRPVPARPRARRLGLAAAASLLVGALAVVPTPVDAAAPADDDALAWVNLYRSTAALPPVTEDASLAAGATLHSQWMLANDVVRHEECVDDACTAPILVPGPGGTVPAVGSTAAGHRAARDSHLFAGTGAPTPHDALVSWMTGPFHMVSILSPRLDEVGFGSASDPGAVTGLRYAAALDVLGGAAADLVPASQYPIAYPADGAVTGTTTYGGAESPDPLTPCGGLTAPTGAPISVQLGDFRSAPDSAPQLTAATFGRVDPTNPTIVTPLPFCAYDGTAGPAGYVNPDGGHQSLGRAILGSHGAIVVIPAAPLVVGQRYRVTVTAGATGTVRSTFTVGTEDDAVGPPPPPFSDVGRYHPFSDEIRWMVSAGLATGFKDGTFRPTAKVSRQAMASFLWKHEGAPVVPCPSELSDVPPGHPFRDPICWMLDAGITEGFSDGTFKPTQAVSRQAAAAFLHRLDGEPVGPFPDPGFSDVGATHPFRTAIAWMVAEGLANGFADGTFRSTAAVTRQAMASFLYRYHFRT